MTRLHQLLEAYISARITPKELEEFSDLVSENEEEVSLYIHELLASDQFGNTNDPIAEEKIYSSLTRMRQKTIEPVTHRIHFLRRGFLKYAAAIIILFGAGAYLWKTSTDQEILSDQNLTKADVTAPEIEKSVITLADGRIISLDSASVGLIATDGKISIEKLNDGRIVYHGLSNQHMSYNTITVPRGSKITSLMLSDGTTVFLNSASSLRYPVAFDGNERRVEVTGEVYFEVSKDPKKKFIVQSGDLITEVLGTHFNINNYENEEAQKVTLLEGKVQVSSGAKKVMLRPGEQATMKTDLNVLTAVDIEDIMAWKNGKFIFNNAGIDEVMREMERWYNIDVVFKNKPVKKFEGSMPRSLTAASVFKILEATGGVKFKIEGNKVIVMK